MKTLISIIIKAISTILLIVFSYAICRIFIFEQFIIPSDSMYPTLQVGDRVIVNKMIFGARIYTDFNFGKNYKLSSFRTKGIRSIKHNDILVFNIPKNDGKISFKINHVYAKRCVALPGDSFSIQNGIYKNNNYKGVLGLAAEQKKLSNTPDSLIPGCVIHALPFDDKNYGWTIKNMGALYIPRKGDVININTINYKLYDVIIKYESGKPISVNPTGQVLLGDSVINKYCFQHNYYFTCGDNVLNSCDSRYWGFTPEEYIVGVVSHITYSKNKYNGKYIWERFGKKLY